MECENSRKNPITRLPVAFRETWINQMANKKRLAKWLTPVSPSVTL